MFNVTCISGVGPFTQVILNVVSRAGLLLEKKVREFALSQSVNPGPASRPKSVVRGPPSFLPEPEEKLPEGWARFYSKEHKAYYYFNKSLEKSVWTLSEVYELEPQRRQHKYTPQSPQPQVNASHSGAQYQPQQPQQVYQQPTQAISPNLNQQYQQQQPVLYYQQQPQQVQQIYQQPAQAIPTNLYQPIQPQQPQVQQLYQQSTRAVSPNINQPYQQQFQPPMPLNEPPREPPDWVELVSPDGKLYYQNNVTKKTQWEKPPAPYIPYGQLRQKVNPVPRTFSWDTK